MQNNQYQKFMQQSVSTMTPVQLVIALYDKAEQELRKAIYYIENKDYENANKSIVKVQNIVSALDSSLKMKYTISESLNSLYTFFRERLVQANIKKDAKILEELIPFFTELKETFEEINKKGH